MRNIYATWGTIAEAKAISKSVKRKRQGLGTRTRKLTAFEIIANHYRETLFAFPFMNLCPLPRLISIALESKLHTSSRSKVRIRDKSIFGGTYYDETKGTDARAMTQMRDSPLLIPEDSRWSARIDKCEAVLADRLPRIFWPFSRFRLTLHHRMG